jgi:hypothetical protein
MHSLLDHVFPGHSASIRSVRGGAGFPALNIGTTLALAPGIESRWAADHGRPRPAHHRGRAQNRCARKTATPVSMPVSASPAPSAVVSLPVVAARPTPYRAPGGRVRR